MSLLYTSAFLLYEKNLENKESWYGSIQSVYSRKNRLLFRFVPPANVFDNNDSSRECFCTADPNVGCSVPNGLFNMYDNWDQSTLWPNRHWLSDFVFAGLLVSLGLPSCSPGLTSSKLTLPCSRPSSASTQIRKNIRLTSTCNRWALNNWSQVRELSMKHRKLTFRQWQWFLDHVH